MREDSLRAVLMVKAIEEIDRAGTVLPPADRAQATRDAVRQRDVDEAALAADDRLLGEALAARAERLVVPLADRHPVVAEALGRTGTPGWLLLALLAVAFASGIGLSALDGSRRINILAFPSLGLIAWNLLMYVLLAVASVQARTRPGPAAPVVEGWFGRFVRHRVGPLLRQTHRVHVGLGEALGQYAAEYGRFGSARIALHLQRWLHLAAATVALGLVVALYWRGVMLRYEAGWESTFLGPGAVRSLVGVLFGPASALSGIELPASDGAMALLEWTADGGGGNAAPWIHLIALSLALYVILPRLALAGVARLASWRTDRSAALPDELRGYAADVLRGSGMLRSAGVASVTPYAYEPSETSLAGLERWAQGAVPGIRRCERRSTLRYGEEDMAVAAFAIGAHREADLHLVLMNLAATPEAENHGVVIAAARDAAHRARPPAAVRIVVDESPSVARLGGDTSLAPRLEERRRLWRSFVAGYGLEADLLPLEDVGGNRGHA